jgi:hypothetical protein
MGTVASDRVVGRAVVIWLSYSDVDFIRWGRIGLQL